MKSIAAGPLSAQHCRTQIVTLRHFMLKILLQIMCLFPSRKTFVTAMFLSLPLRKNARTTTQEQDSSPLPESLERGGNTLKFSEKIPTRKAKKGSHSKNARKKVPRRNCVTKILRNVRVNFLVRFASKPLFYWLRPSNPLELFSKFFGAVCAMLWLCDSLLTPRVQVSFSKCHFSLGYFASTGEFPGNLPLYPCESDTCS